jgi:hypothetical protein
MATESVFYNLAFPAHFPYNQAPQIGKGSGPISEGDFFDF